MLAHSRFIDNYSPFIPDVYENITAYFDNPIMYRLPDDAANFATDSIYVVRVSYPLNLENKIVMAVVPRDHYSVGTSRPMRDLQWKSISTFYTNKYSSVPAYQYVPKRDAFSGQKISLANKYPNFSEYLLSNTSFYPIKIILYHKEPIPFNSDRQEYADTGTIASAIETYNTMLSLNIDKQHFEHQ